MRELAKAKVAVVPLLVGSGIRPGDFGSLGGWYASGFHHHCESKVYRCAMGNICYLQTAPRRNTAAMEGLLACSDLRESLAGAGSDLLLEKEFHMGRSLCIHLAFLIHRLSVSFWSAILEQLMHALPLMLTPSAAA